MKPALNNLIKKKMTRKEFIISLGVLFLLITGISGILKNIFDFSSSKKIKNARTGYGTGPYGI